MAILQRFVDKFTYEDDLNTSAPPSLQDKTSLSENACGWFEFNDDRVRPFDATEENINRKWFGGNDTECSAKTLFYDRVIPVSNQQATSSPIRSHTFSRHETQGTNEKQGFSSIDVLLPSSDVKTVLEENYANAEYNTSDKKFLGIE